MLKQINDYYHLALDGNVVLTKFLDLAEINQINSLNKDDLCVYLEGGYENAERCRAIVQNKYYECPKIDEYKIEIYYAKYKKTYKEINHRNILGSIMSLGIDRNTIGDIYIYDDNIYLFLSSEIAKYVIQNMPMVNNQNLNFQKVHKVDLLHSNKETIISINVSSFRLDAIIARSLNISREKACEIIISGNVYINHVECKSIDKKCIIGDIISIRKFGRLSIYEYVKTTKKDRLVLNIGVKH